MNKKFLSIPLIILLALLPSINYGGGLDLIGQASATGLLYYSQNEWNKLFGLRYIPQITYTEYLTEEWFFDTEVSLNTFFSSDFNSSDQNIKLYRFKLRFATSQSETRIGLQKINFGPAYLLRSLRWFDRLDPRDPLGLTNGVYALRFKYNFLNNSSLTLWGLYRNSELKGYDIFPTSTKKPEFGGRFLFPFLEGESGITAHTRTVNASSFEYRETKLALDGRWDVEVGLWFESTLQKNDSELLPYQYSSITTVGSDYTFDIGNGLHTMAEHMITTAGKEFMGSDQSINISALMINYPYSLVDNFMGLVYYSWDTKQFYKFIQWQRIYDYLIINLSLFHYPENGIPTLSGSNHLPTQGYGFQLTFIYNH